MQIKAKKFFQPTHRKRFRSPFIYSKKEIIIEIIGNIYVEHSQALKILSKIPKTINYT
jgi:hypothetical protein